MGGVVEKLAFIPPNNMHNHEYMKSQCPKNCRMVNSKSGKISTIFFEDPSFEYTILYSHGNAEDLGVSWPSFQDMAALLQCNFLAYDYSGYGLSETEVCSEQGCYDNIEGAFQWLTEDRKIDRNKIILFGRSLGSGPTVHLASKERGLAGLILQSPLRSAVKTQMWNWVGSVMGSNDIFQNENKIDKVTDYPVLIIHGTIDGVVPFAHGEYLYNELSKVNKNVHNYWVKGCGHNDIEYNRGDEYNEKLQTFINHNIRGVKSLITEEYRSKSDRRSGVEILPDTLASVSSNPVSHDSTLIMPERRPSQK